MSMFRKAVRKQRPLRMALYGPSGSGKSFTALTVARNLVGEQGRIAVIDTERSSADIYAAVGFDSVNLESYSPTDYIKVIEAAASEKYDALVIDSLSHAWEAEGGLLSIVDEVARAEASRSGKADSFRAWGSPKVKQAEQGLWGAILGFPGHVIVTMRVKTSYEVTTDANGKKKVEKLGLAPIQRANVEYEFDIIGRMDADNSMLIEKARDPEGKMEGHVISKPGKKFAEAIARWLNEGEAAPAAPEKQAAPTEAPATEKAAEPEAPAPSMTRADKMRIRLGDVCEAIAAKTNDRVEGIKGNAWGLIQQWYGVKKPSDLTDEQFEELLGRLADELAPAGATA